MYSRRLSPLSVVSCIEMVPRVNSALTFFNIYYIYQTVGKPNLILILCFTCLQHFDLCFLP
jgi:hypothetical protein